MVAHADAEVTDHIRSEWPAGIPGCGSEHGAATGRWWEGEENDHRSFLHTVANRNLHFEQAGATCLLGALEDLRCSFLLSGSVASMI